MICEFVYLLSFYSVPKIVFLHIAIFPVSFRSTGRYYRKAYKRNIALKLFETKKGAAARRQAKPDKDGNIELIDTLDDIPQEEDEEEENKAQDALGKLFSRLFFI